MLSTAARVVLALSLCAVGGCTAARDGGASRAAAFDEVRPCGTRAPRSSGPLAGEVAATVTAPSAAVVTGAPTSLRVAFRARRAVPPVVHGPAEALLLDSGGVVVGGQLGSSLEAQVTGPLGAGQQQVVTQQVVVRSCGAPLRDGRYRLLVIYPRVIEDTARSSSDAKTLLVSAPVPVTVVQAATASRGPAPTSSAASSAGPATSRLPGPPTAH